MSKYKLKNAYSYYYSDYCGSSYDDMILDFTISATPSALKNADCHASYKTTLSKYMDSGAVIESLNRTSSSVGNDTYYIGQDDGERTETLQIIELDDFSQMEFQLRYRQGGFTIGEKVINNKETTPQSQWLYYQDGINYKYDYPESICKSYDAAIEYIQEKLSKYNLESRIGVSCNNVEDPDTVPIFIECREGIRQDVPLDSIASLELKDKMYWGVNSEFSTEELSSDTSETFEQDSTLGVWDSADGDIRLIFESMGSDFAVTYDGFESANGNVMVINFITGTKECASYIIDGDQITFVYDLNKYIWEFLLNNNELIIDEKVFCKVDKALANRLIGTWENDEMEIQFGEKNDVMLCDKTGNRSNIYGTYAVLNESEVWLNSDNEDITILNYSINGNMLDCNGTILYKNEVEKEKIVGTWINKEDSCETYYVFHENGYYECYATGQLYSLGVLTEEGTYEMADVNKIRLYANDYRFAFVELEYSTDDVILNSAGKQYTKVDA